MWAPYKYMQFIITFPRLQLRHLIIMDSQYFTPFIPYVFIIIGIVVIVVTVLAKPAVNRLAQAGEHCEGLIFKQEYNEGNAMYSNAAGLKNKITIRFVTKEKEWVTEVLNTDFISLTPWQFKEGQKVQVLYDPKNPRDFTILNHQSPRLTKTILILVGTACIAFGIYKLCTGT
jgi:hypothetical protein